MFARDLGPAAWLAASMAAAIALVAGTCAHDGSDDAARTIDASASNGPTHAPIADGITGPLGTAMPRATPEQRAAFERGRASFVRRRRPSEGLGPEYSGVSCGDCHERPTPGGSAGLYRNMYFAGAPDADGELAFSAFHAESEDVASSAGLVRLYRIPTDTGHARSALGSDVVLLVARNPPALYGAGLVASISEEEILSHADPDDLDGDGVSGRANTDVRHVGRFGSQAIAAGLLDFVHVEVFLELGVTVQPVDDVERAALPFADDTLRTSTVFVADPADPIADPEMRGDEFADLVTFVQLLAGPELTPLDATSAAGRDLFDGLGCASCHVPRMASAVGPIPLYSDLLLHDMGETLGDALAVEEAHARELRTAPLWGVAAVAPYLHDGRARTLDEAIRAHGGEASPAERGYARASDGERSALLAFLRTLGGADLESPGLLPPDAPVPAVGELGGPDHALDAVEHAAFTDGRAAFDEILGLAAGVGAPQFNGDSCRACHFDPVIGGAGPPDVDVIRQAFADASGTLHEPASGSIAFRERLFSTAPDQPPADANVQEHRQTPALFGLGLLDGVSDAEILSREDPDDARAPAGISGRAGRSPVAGAVGRFGWKSRVPHLSDFVREALSVELGMTVPPGGEFGDTTDGDAVADPEADAARIDRIRRYLMLLGPPPRGPIDDTVRTGDVVFARIGCADCHVPTIAGASGPVHAYTDLLLHDIARVTAPGIIEANAQPHEYRTAPLWGISHTAPYLHSGEAETLEAAIAGHTAEGAAAASAFATLSELDRAALLAFLASL
jgi:CxxC motif-containing protein (DUF1111 family)